MSRRRRKVRLHRSLRDLFTSAWACLTGGLLVLGWMLMVFNLDFDKLITFCSWSFILRSYGAGTLGCAVDDQGVVVVGFNGDVVDCCSREVAVEVIVVGVLFEVETGDEAVHEAVMTGEMAVEFINVIEDWGEITIDSSSVSECRGELRERGHFGC
jgi:hypothetical protein